MTVGEENSICSADSLVEEEEDFAQTEKDNTNEERNEKYFTQFLKENNTLFECYDEDFKIDDCKIIAKLFQTESISSKLQTIEIWNCEFSDEGYEILFTALKYLSSLISLDLSNNDGIGGTKGCKSLANSIKHLSTLEIVNLSFNNIGDDECNILFFVDEMSTNLKSL